MKYKNHTKLVYMLSVQCEELRIKHLTLLLVLTMPYACWVLCRWDYIEDFEWCLHFQFGVVFWRVVVREVYFEGPNRIWRALKTSILNIVANSHTRLRAHDHCTLSTLIGEKGGAGPSSLDTMLQGPLEYVNARWMCKVYMDSYVALNGSCFMVT